MTWSRKLSKPIPLKDGRILTTLADARAIVLALPERHQRNEHWLYAGELLFEAATRQGPMKITVAQLERALKAEGLI
ncbi:MAG: hypothetical protein ACLQDM_23850 [Bradyrhizobium sp.]|jgi:hypothetical protein